jgi:hypothetical protein
VPRDQAGELEGAGFCELPQNFAVGAGRKTFRVRVIVLHIGKLLHQCGVLPVFLYGRENELVIVDARIFQNEADLFALAHRDEFRLESHFLSVFAHHDLDSAGRLLGVTWLAGGKALVTFVGVCGTVQVGTNRADFHQNEKQRSDEQSIGTDDIVHVQC